MNRFNHRLTMPLKFKLLIILFPLVLLPTLLAAWFSYDQAKQNNQKQVTRLLNYHLDNTASQFETQLIQAQQSLSWLGKRQALLAMQDAADMPDRSNIPIQPSESSASRPAHQAVSELFNRYLQYHPDYQSLRLLDSSQQASPQQIQGLCRTQSDEVVECEHIVNVDKIRETSESMWLGEDEDSSNPENLVFWLQHKLTLQHTAHKYILLLSINLDDLFKEMPKGKHSTMPSNTILTLLSDRQGHILHPHHFDEYSPKNEREEESRLPLSSVIEVEIDKKTNHIPKSLLLDIPGLITQEMFVLQRKSKYNFYWFSLLPKQRIVEPLRKQQNLFILLLVLSVLLSLYVISLMIDKLIISPLKYLIESHHHIRQGEWRTELKNTHDQEFSQLYTQFNHLNNCLQNALIELKENSDNLEKQVKQRTYKLEHLNIELEQERHRAESANIAKSQFIANLSHELRTPLNGILGMSEVVLRLPLSKEIRIKIVLIQDAGQALLALINELLDVSRLEMGHMVLKEENFNLLEILKEIVSVMHHKATEKGLSINLRHDQAMPYAVIGDDKRIRQILFNLISNAIKFTQQGGITIQINKVSLDEHSLCFQIVIIDTGIGIPKDKLETLFELFQQLDDSDRRSYGGMGVGLFVCKQLVHLMGGEIYVQSSHPEKGARFWFELSLPLKKQVSEKQIKTNTKPRLLLVDDKQANRAVAKVMLENLGYQLDLAETGEQAVQMEAQQHYDLIFIDLEMPIMDGYQTTLAIRQQPQPRSLIVALTTQLTDEVRQQCEQVDIDKVMMKPMTLGDLNEILNSCVATQAD